MLTSLLLIPIIGSLIILPIQENSSNNINKIKNISLTTALINFIVSIFLWINFDSSISQFQFVYEFNQLSFCHFNVGVDSLSLYFVLITTFITPVAILASYNKIIKK